MAIRLRGCTAVWLAAALSLGAGCVNAADAGSDGGAGSDGASDGSPGACDALGLKDGGCGLRGACVACNRDADCGGGRRCSEDGTCVFSDPCQYDFDCLPGSPGCVDGHCEARCASGMDCLYGQVCREWCEDGQCGSDGACPDGYVEVPGSNHCLYDPCRAQGFGTGLCGLWPRCVECIVNVDCPAGKVCDLGGACVEPGCRTDDACPAGLRCVFGVCSQPCASDAECGEGQACQADVQACQPVRCRQMGLCSRPGWRPVPGTLACALAR